MSIIIQNLSKTFSPGHVQALKNVTLEFKDNQITGLIGFNGSGKTTTFNILTECIELIDSGNITYEGKKLDLNVKRQISFLTAGGERRYYKSAKSHLIMIAKLHGAKKQWINEKLKYYSKLFKFEQYLSKSIKSLSKGNRQKVKIIASFLNPNCKYMFLDEPFEGLDPIMIRAVKREYMKLENITIIISSHLMDVIEDMVKEFYILKDGVVVDSKKVEHKEVIIRVNREIILTDINEMSCVINIKKTDKHIDILIDNKANFAKVNKELINLPKYEFSSLVEKQVALSTIEHYEDENV